MAMDCAMQALKHKEFDAAVWLLQQPGGARLEVFADQGALVVLVPAPACASCKLFRSAASAYRCLDVHVVCCRILGV